MADDVRAILTLDKSGKRERGQKESKKKPDGVNREVFALIGGAPPIAPAPEKPAVMQKKRNLKLPAEKWILHGFENTARTDGLKLNHWVKEKEISDEYAFAKLNKKIDIVPMNSEDYDKIAEQIKSDWSKEETLHLWDLCERFDLRFIVIHDRFEYSRSIEEIKDRYYSVSKKLLEERGDYNHPIVKKPYNFEYEVRRKNNLEKLFLRTKEQQEYEKQLLEEVKKLE